MAQSLIYQTEKLACSFTDINGAAADPSALTLKIYHLAPDGMLTLKATYAKGDLTKTATGAYYLLYTPTEAGKYYIDLFTTESAGTSTVAVRKEFDVANALS